MHFYVGTSGYSYKEWKGSFYPEKIPSNQMLSYYAQRFSVVEINGTFTRMPSQSAVESWAAQVPGSFRFVLKAPRTITHFKRLKNAEETTDDLLQATAVLKDQLGPLLFQLPPNFKKDVQRLDAFLNFLDGKARVAFEFRHESWFDDEVFACLRAHSCALCAADTDEGPSAPLVRTAAWGYVRLRSEGYSAKDLKRWIEQLRSQEWREAYVFFKHEETGSGPKLAKRFLKLAAQ